MNPEKVTHLNQNPHFFPQQEKNPEIKKKRVEDAQREALMVRGGRQTEKKIKDGYEKAPHCYYWASR